MSKNTKTTDHRKIATSELNLAQVCLMGKHDLGWIQFLEDGERSFWAKKLDKPRCLEKVTKVFKGFKYTGPRIEGVGRKQEVVYEIHKAYYHVGFEVELRIDGVRARSVEPALSRGTRKNARLEAQFYFGPGMRATVARVCAFVWGDTGKYTGGKTVDCFFTFQEFGTVAADKTYDAHHLPYVGKGGHTHPPRTDYAMPHELVIAYKETHKDLHRRM